jgi:hypothetical protein
MALIEYNIQYNRKNEMTNVTCRILAVGGPGPDKIRFKSNDSKTAIWYIGGTPFDHRDPTAPQPDKVFSVGKKTKEFEVVRSLTRENRLHFRCGEAVPVAAKRASRAIAGGYGGGTTTGSTLKFKAWKGGGNGTPPDF